MNLAAPGLALALSLLASITFAEEPRAVSPVPDAVRSEYKLAPFYRKCVLAGGIPIISSDKPQDLALLEAAWILDRMLAGRDDLRAAIAKSKTRLAIMAVDEFTTDIPEHSDLTPAAYWNRRARGLGATPVRPAVSTGEENLLCCPGDPYARENILVHEFGHVIHERGLDAVDPTFDRRLREIFEAAQRDGLWKGTYASTNRAEYWAEGVQSWFDTNDRHNAEHGDIDTREKLRAYDPRFAALLAEVFRDNDWRYTRPTTRLQLPHLAGYAAAKLPTFAWPKDATHQLPLLAAVSAPPSLSPPSSTKTSIVFRNRTPGEVQIAWVDFQGGRKPYGPVRPGVVKMFSTFAGHVWVASAGGRDLATFIASEDPREAVIEPAGAKP